MGKIRAVWNRWRKPLKYSASDPENFAEKWSFTSNRLRIFSLLFVSFSLIIYGFLYFFSPWFVAVQGSKGIKREQLEVQAKQIEDLQKELLAQERYINSMRLIILGEVPVTSSMDSLNEYSTEMIDSLFDYIDSASVALENRMKQDMRTKGKSSITSLFIAPVNGVVSQSYKKGEHTGIDIVTEPETNVLAALSGTVIYTGYTRKDGFITIIHHGGGYVSVYKHCKAVFKKSGDRVQIGDPIGIVGNTGENSTGPHLHFEVWLDQQPIDPTAYLSFKK